MYAQKRCFAAQEEVSESLSMSGAKINQISGYGGSGDSLACAVRPPLPHLPRHLPLALVGSNVVNL